MSNPSYEINKALEDALRTLNLLDRALTSSRGSDVDYVPNETTQKVYNALENLNQALKTKEGIKELRGRGNVLDIMARLDPKLDTPAVQTALGTMAVELSGVFRTVQNALQEEDINKEIEKKKKDGYAIDPNV